jgi:hypothetical protein
MFFDPCFILRAAEITITSRHRDAKVHDPQALSTGENRNLNNQ